MNGFYLVAEVETRRWPFRWGPFGGKRKLRFHFKSGIFGLSQRDSGRINNFSTPLAIDCYDDGKGHFTTTIGFDGSARLKRRTRT